MDKFRKNKGITLIALVITIIILLILAGISIAMLTGENGLLTKASKADKETDIVDTKEQIKLEIMGSFNEKTAKYTNQDVINAVEKITGVTVEENAPIVESKKGNEVDISDLWIPIIYIQPLYFGGDYVKIPYAKGQVWTREYLLSLPEETEVSWMRSVWGESLGDPIQFDADGYAFPFLLLDGKVVKYGDPLISGGHYESGELFE